MTLGELLAGVDVVSASAPLSTAVSTIRIHSAEVRPGDVFVCMKGVKDDGAAHIAEITVPFIAVSETPLGDDIPHVLVRDARAAYAVMSKNFFRDPAAGMKFVAVVGTNGKTSTAHYIASLLTQAGMKVGLIGTEGHYILGERVATGLTTPDSFELYGLMTDMRARGVDTVVAEVSAHAIALKKTEGLTADIAVLTNITRDHLDFFVLFRAGQSEEGDRQHRRSFGARTRGAAGGGGSARRDLRPRRSRGQFRGRFGSRARRAKVRRKPFGRYRGCRISDDIVDVVSPLSGMFNVYNLLAALTAAHELGVDAVTLTRAVRRVHAVRGRFSVLRNDKGSVIIDYAHTPDGLSKLLHQIAADMRVRLRGRARRVQACGHGRHRGKTERPRHHHFGQSALGGPRRHNR